MPAKIIAIAHSKGGTGKTTTAINLGVGLAKRGKKVLLVDIDPQGNLTRCLGVKDRDGLENTLATGMDAVLSGKEIPKDACVRSHQEGIAFIGANRTLSAIDAALSTALSRETVLKAFLIPFLSDYDYILLDCLPSLGLLFINALTAADSVLIAVQAEDLAVDNMAALLDSVRLIKRRLNPALSIEGILLTMVDSRTNMARRIVTQMRETYGDAVFRSVIPRSVRLGEQSDTGRSIYVSDAKGKAAQQYQALAEEVLAHGGKS